MASSPRAAVQFAFHESMQAACRFCRAHRTIIIICTAALLSVIGALFFLYVLLTVSAEWLKFAYATGFDGFHVASNELRSIRSFFQFSVVMAALLWSAVVLLIVYFFPPLRHLVDPDSVNISAKTALSTFVLATAAILISIGLYLSTPRGPIRMEFEKIAAILSILFSVCGVLIATFTIIDHRRIISNSQYFIRRFKFMLREAKSLPAEDSWVRIMAYTPLPGVLGIRGRQDEYADRELLDLIRDHLLRLEIICLDEDGLRTWAESFQDKMTKHKHRIEKSDIDSVVQDVENFIRGRGPVPPNPFGMPFTSDEVYRNAHPPLRGGIDELPTFFAYFSKTRALVITPLFNPMRGLSFDQQPSLLKDREVEMFGFETSDERMIDSLTAQFVQVRDVIVSRS